MMLTLRRNRTALVFAACCAWIAAISVHDAVLVVVHHELISQYEQNPLGKWLLQLHGDDVWPFLLVKLAGTAAVCTVLVRLYQFRSAIALPVVSALSCFQLLLLLYLHFW